MPASEYLCGISEWYITKYVFCFPITVFVSTGAFFFFFFFFQGIIYYLKSLGFSSLQGMIHTSAEDIYSSMAPDPTFMLPYTRFCICLLDYDYVLHIVNFAILYCIKCAKITCLMP
jgi:hypothetical protein